MPCTPWGRLPPSCCLPVVAAPPCRPAWPPCAAPPARLAQASRWRAARCGPASCLCWPLPSTSPRVRGGLRASPVEPGPAACHCSTCGACPRVDHLHTVPRACAPRPPPRAHSPLVCPWVQVSFTHQQAAGGHTCCSHHAAVQWCRWRSACCGRRLATSTRTTRERCGCSQNLPCPGRRALGPPLCRPARLDALAQPPASSALSGLLPGQQPA